MAVPLPAGRPVPAGRMAMSHALRSASEIGLPRSGVSATAAGAAQANAIASRSLRVDMLDLPAAVDPPARRAVVVLVGKPKRVAHGCLGLAAGGDELRARRLCVAGFIPRAAHENDWLTVPAPRHAEAGECLGKHRALQRRLRPALAAVGRDHDPRYAAGAGICDAGNFVIARPLQRVAE